MFEPADRLRQLADLLPPGAELILRSDDLRALADGAQTRAESAAVADLTLAEVGERVGRSVSTVREWCNSGSIRGAYKLRGREWRVPAGALRAFLDRQERPVARPRPQLRGHLGSEDLGSWQEDGR